MLFVRIGGRRGAASTEWIAIVFLMVVIGVALVTVLGRNLARRAVGTVQSLDQGTPIAKSALPEPTTAAQVGAPGPAPIARGPLGNVAAPAAGDPVTNPGGTAAARTPDDTLVAGDWSLGNPTGWNPAAILAGMSQVDQGREQPGAAWDTVRCALASALASRIVAGPEAVDRLLLDLQLRARNGSMPNSTPGPPPTVGGYTVDEYVAMLGQLRDRLASQTLDHADLGLIQALMYEGYSLRNVPDGGGGTMQGTFFQAGAGAQNYQAVMELGRGVDSTGATIGPPGSANNQFQRVNSGQLAANITALQPGESMTLGVDEFTPGVGWGGDGNPDHFILVGRDAAGRPYIYDPWPHPAPAAGGPAPSQFVYFDQNPEIYQWYLQNAGPAGGFYQYGVVRH